VTCLSSAVISLLLAGPAAHLQIQPDRLQQSLSQGRFAEAAKELQQVVLQSGPSLKKPSPAQEKVLRGAIEKARRVLIEKHPIQDKTAARQVLCLSRAYFPEDLPRIEKALRVGADVHGPELVGERVRRFSPEARQAGIQGAVVVEVVIDQEGCVRHPKVLKGVPSLDSAALAMVQSWTFRPANLGGKDVAVHYILIVPFKLSDPD